MSLAAVDVSDEEHSLFRPFTRKSLQAIEARIAQGHAKQKELEKKRPKGENEDEEKDEATQPDPTLEQGATIPVKLHSSFPPELASTPLEDIDNFYHKQRTFVVISKGKDIFRFSAANALWILNPFNPIRRLAIYILVHPLSSVFITCTILLNCILMIMPTTPTIVETEEIFTGIYTFELVVKVIARGFILQPFSYLRDAWNWLDFLVTALAYVTMRIDLGNLGALRAFRVLRALKIVPIVPGLKGGAVTEFVKNLHNVIMLTIFSLSFFALMGLQMYMGVLTQKCIKNFPEDGSAGNLSDHNWHKWCSNDSNWEGEDDFYPLCGNASGAGMCKPGYTCIEGFGKNPNYGYTSFDTFGWAFLSTFRLMMKDYWENLYQLVLRSAGPWHMLFFILIIFFSSFYLISLILAIVIKSYNELQKKAEEVEAADKVAIRRVEEGAISKENKQAADVVNAAGEVASVAKPLSHVLSAIQEKSSSDDNSKEKTSIRSNFLSQGRPSTGQEGHKVSGDSSVDMGVGMSQNKHQDNIFIDPTQKQTGMDMKGTVAIYSYFPTEDNKGSPTMKEKTITNCMRGINIFCVWDCCRPWLKFQEFIALIIFDPFVELFIMICVIMNTVFMALDHHDMNKSMEETLKSGNYFFTAVYVIEATMKLIAMSPKYYFQKGWNIFDFIIVALSLLELGLEGVQGLSVLRSFRLLRVFKLAKSWPTLNSFISFMWCPVRALDNLIFVLCIFIFVFAVIGMQLFGRNYVDNVDRFPEGELPRWNFTDFMHSFMIVFRLLCGEWIESMWDCMYVGDVSCVPFFLAAVVIGNLVVLNLFLALILSNFGLYSLSAPAADNETNKIAEAFDRFRHFNVWVGHNLLNMAKNIRAKLTNQKADQTTDVEEEEVEHNETVTKDVSDYPADCCPDVCCCRFPFRAGDDDTPFWQGWANLRLKTFQLIKNKYFETAIITIIMLSSLTLALEDVNLPSRPILQNILYYMDMLFTVIFLLEMLIKWLALGFAKYFINAWCWLDFVVVMLSLRNLVASLAGAATIPVFRTLRVLRSLHAVRHLEGMRVVGNALVQAVSSIFNLLLVCLFFWLIFAIIGVQLFAGKYYKCVDANGTTLSHEVTPDRNVCIAENYTWENSPMNFDHVGNAYLCLFQVATLKGWIQVMNDAIDSREVGMQPIRETNIYMYLYFVFFIIFGSFFMFILVIAVIIDKFKEEKKKAGGSLDMFMTEDQKKYYNAMKKMDSNKPLKAIPRPRWLPQAIAFKIVTDKKFDMIIMLVIILNMLTLTMDHFQQTQNFDNVLYILNTIFIVIFSSECILKIFALRYYYFKEPWNVFEFIVVILSILGMILSDFIKTDFVSPTLLGLVRVTKIGQVLRLVKGAKGIRTLLFRLAMSLPALFNICLLLFLITFIFAIFGMSFFMNVKEKSGLDDIYNFKTFPNSMILLFQMSTLAGWDGVLDGITNEEDCEQPNPEMGSPGDCGSSTVGITFLLSYLVISFLIVINMYIAVILENYSQATDDMQEELTDDDYDMYYNIWQQFDPDGTQYIHYNQLSEFLDTLEPPLQIHKPNRYKIVSMDIPLCKGDLMFCVDILDALTKDLFTRKGNPIEETVKLAEVALVRRDKVGYEPVSSTLWRQREEYCARLIQKAWRKQK